MMKRVNNLGIILIILLTIGCGKKQRVVSNKTLLYNDTLVSEKDIRMKIESLRLREKFQEAYKLIDTLFSNNKENGFLYYQRGSVEGYDFAWSSALIDFKKAEALNYKPEDCKEMIKVCNIMLNASQK